MIHRNDDVIILKKFYSYQIRTYPDYKKIDY